MPFMNENGIRALKTDYMYFNNKYFLMSVSDSHYRMYSDLIKFSPNPLQFKILKRSGVDNS